MADTPMLGCIYMFAGNFAPRGYQLCQGQLLPIAQYTALFSLLGTTYGGNGQTTFALPDLRGRSPIGAGQGPGLTNIESGEAGGTENATLLSSNMPMHNHVLSADSSEATAGTPSNGYLADSSHGHRETRPIYSSGPANTTLNLQSIGFTGGNAPFDIRNPYLGINYIIAMEGIFPSRD